jgi:hypothetical protein
VQVNSINVWSKYAAVVKAVALSAGAAFFILLARSLVTGTERFSFMAFNLVLSLLALLAAICFAYFWQQSKKWL